MSQANVNLGIFQETKITAWIYMRESSGYRVAASEAPSAHSSGIAMFYFAVEKFSVEALQLRGANVAIFQLASGSHK